MTKTTALLIYLLLSAGHFANSQTPDGKEMRGVWVATVKHLDYPSSSFLSVKEQKKEFTDMLDFFSDIGINTVFFQVRPAADAFFDSPYEPWSEWLTGEQGKAPEPYYDPLKFMIKECHKRNIEFHAWINPFRAVATIEYADICENHITKRKPEWFFTYDINKYFNPGIPEVRNYIIKIIEDIVKRYDIDGIHFDDYFYPYPVRNERKKIIPVPDYETFKKYGSGFDNIEDWRRNNLNIFIKDVNNAVKEIKPEISFGVSPSGVWRNKSKDPEGSDTRGLAHYDYLFSDVLKWLKEGWIDYVVPQLYWTVGNKYADYRTLVKWWSKHTYGKHLYIGHAVYNAGKDAVSPAWRNPDELPEQIRINRKNPVVFGSVFYRAASLKKNPLGFCDSLRNNFYKEKVLPPDIFIPDFPDTSLVVINNNDDIINRKEEQTEPPVNLTVTKLGRNVMISWDFPDKNAVFFVRNKTENKIIKETNDKYVILSGKRIPFLRKKQKITVTAKSKNKKESKPGNAVTVRL